MDASEIRRKERFLSRHRRNVAQCPELAKETRNPEEILKVLNQLRPRKTGTETQGQVFLEYGPICDAGQWIACPSRVEIIAEFFNELGFDVQFRYNPSREGLTFSKHGDVAAFFAGCHEDPLVVKGAIHNKSFIAGKGCMRDSWNETRTWAQELKSKLQAKELRRQTRIIRISAKQKETLEQKQDSLEEKLVSSIPSFWFRIPEAGASEGELGLSAEEVEAVCSGQLYQDLVSVTLDPSGRRIFNRKMPDWDGEISEATLAAITSAQFVNEVRFSSRHRELVSLTLDQSGMRRYFRVRDEGVSFKNEDGSIASIRTEGDSLHLYVDGCPQESELEFFEIFADGVWTTNENSGRISQEYVTRSVSRIAAYLKIELQENPEESEEEHLIDTLKAALEEAGVMSEEVLASRFGYEVVRAIRFTDEFKSAARIELDFHGRRNYVKAKPERTLSAEDDATLGLLLIVENGVSEAQFVQLVGSEAVTAIRFGGNLSNCIQVTVNQYGQRTYSPRNPAFNTLVEDLRTLKRKQKSPKHGTLLRYR